MDVKDIKLSDLQKLAINYFLATGFLNYVLFNSKQFQALLFTVKHIELIESILGSEIMKVIKNNPKDREYLFNQANDFLKMMTSQNETKIEDLFNTEDDEN